ncbi:hypothetical protein PtB15_5B318 [Puccinia triticina]|nr:hypothetical protein PtB15_5B318 [Puccinia triticina]
MSVASADAAQLLALHNSPLCVRPPALKPLSEWFGDCDFNSVRSQPNHAPPNANTSPNQRPSQQQQTSPDNKSQALSQSLASLPVLGRSQPPARNPFANFGKFGTEELPSSLHLNGPNSPLNSSSIKGGRRLIDRDCAPHIARTDNLNIDGSRRKPNENSLGTGKERNANQRIPDDQGSADGKLNNNTTSNRRTLDRYVPDRDRDDARLRNRERERERDVERDKTRRSSINPRDGTTGDEQMNWRRPPPGTTAGQPTKRSTSYHQQQQQQANNPARANKDTPDTRDHSVREKDREKTINNNKYPQTSNSSNRNNNQQRAREKENTTSSQLPSSGSLATASRETPPISPNVSLTSHPTRRVKDGAWDSGEGKWEISKPSNGLRNDNGYGSSETDAIQTWKAEMKALEAQKKLAAAAATDSQDHSSTALKEEHRPAGGSAAAAIDTHVDKPDRDFHSNPSKQFDFTAISGTPDESGLTSSHPANENELAVLPRASRFAKFFDHNKDGSGQQPGSLLTDKGSPTKGAGSPSVDPENMARVLSMLQMSSKTSEPPSESAPTAQAHPSPFQLLNKAMPSNGQSPHYSRDAMGFAQLHGASATSPTAVHAPGMRSIHEAELGDRIQAADDHTLDHLLHHTHPSSSTPFANFAGDSPQRSSSAHPIGGLEDHLSSHSSADRFGHLSGSQSAANHPFGSQNGHGSQSVGSATNNQPFNLFTTNHPPHVKSPIDASFAALRNQAPHDPQMFQLRHMLHSVNSNSLTNIPAQQLAHDRSNDNQKLAFLSRQLHQQRLAIAGANSSVNGTSHGLQHLNSAPGPNGIVQLPSANGPHTAALNNLFLHHQQVPAHHPGILPPTVTFAGSPTGVQTGAGGGRPGPVGFGHPAPQMLPGLQHHPMQQPQPHPALGNNPNAVQQLFQIPLANLPPPPQQHNAQLDLMSLLNAGNQRRIGM